MVRWVVARQNAAVSAYRDPSAPQPLSMLLLSCTVAFQRQTNQQLRTAHPGLPIGGLVEGGCQLVCLRDDVPRAGGGHVCG